MKHSPPHVRRFAIALAAVAGFVDAIGFLALGGRFVSFMSGNSTRLAVDGARGTADAWLAGGLIGAFVTGVVAGTLVGRTVGPRRQAAVVGLVAAILTGAAALVDAGLPRAAVALLAVAMGAENAVFERDGEVAIGVTYMTGTLVKVGQHLATAVAGGARFGWLPYLGLWLGLLAGGVAGAFADFALGLDAIWLAAGAATLLALAATRA